MRSFAAVAARAGHGCGTIPWPNDPHGGGGQKSTSLKMVKLKKAPFASAGRARAYAGKNRRGKKIRQARQKKANLCERKPPKKSPSAKGTVKKRSAPKKTVLCTAAAGIMAWSAFARKPKRSECMGLSLKCGRNMVIYLFLCPKNRVVGAV